MLSIKKSFLICTLLILSLFLLSKVYIISNPQAIKQGGLKIKNLKFSLQELPPVESNADIVGYLTFEKNISADKPFIHMTAATIKGERQNLNKTLLNKGYKANERLPYKHYKTPSLKNKNNSYYFISDNKLVKTDLDGKILRILMFKFVLAIKSNSSFYRIDKKLIDKYGDLILVVEKGYYFRKEGETDSRIEQRSLIIINEKQEIYVINMNKDSSSVTLSPDGNIYVSNNSKIEEYDRQAHLVKTINIPVEANNLLAVDREKNIYLKKLWQRPPIVFKLNQAGEKIGQETISSDSYSPIIGVDEVGKLYYRDQIANNMKIICRKTINTNNIEAHFIKNKELETNSENTSFGLIQETCWFFFVDYSSYIPIKIGFSS